MANEEVLGAFLNRETAVASGLHTDGTRLCLSDSLIAEWKDGVLKVVSAQGSPEVESHKDDLVDFILRKIQREELLWQLVKPKHVQISRSATLVG